MVFGIWGIHLNTSLSVLFERRDKSDKLPTYIIMSCAIMITAFLVFVLTSVVVAERRPVPVGYTTTIHLTDDVRFFPILPKLL